MGEIFFKLFCTVIIQNTNSWKLDTSQNQLKLQSNGKPAKKSETQVFKQGKNRDGSSNSSFKTDEDMQDYNFEEDKEF